nr:hypothetical protein [Acuticoccus sediminis]
MEDDPSDHRAKRPPRRGRFDFIGGELRPQRVKVPGQVIRRPRRQVHHVGALAFRRDHRAQLLHLLRNSSQPSHDCIKRRGWSPAELLRELGLLAFGLDELAPRVRGVAGMGVAELLALGHVRSGVGFHQRPVGQVLPQAVEHTFLGVGGWQCPAIRARAGLLVRGAAVPLPTDYGQPGAAHAAK